MQAFAQKTQQSTSGKSTARRAQSQQSQTVSPVHQLQQTIGNRALQRLVHANAGIKEDATSRGSATVNEKSVTGGARNFVDDLLVERSPNEKNGDTDAAAAQTPAQTPPVAAKVKKAGVDSFLVTWAKHPSAGAARASFRLDYTAEFKKDADHDPALAEFRQSVMSTWDITEGPHKGRKGTTAPMHDDNYSRADDQGGNTIVDVDFTSNDKSGWDDLHKNDVLDYSFTAEQTIIDTSQSNKVIATRGPHTATIKGKNPRTYAGVPTILS